MIVDSGSRTGDIARGNVISVKCMVQKLKAGGHGDLQYADGFG